MGDYVYCIASVSILGGKPDVSYYAYKEDVYGLHRVGDYEDPNVVWYNTEKEALKARWNANDCVIALCKDYLPQFKKSKKLAEEDVEVLK